VVPRFDDVDTDGARRIVEGALRRGEGWLTSSEAQALMAAMRIATAGARLVASEADAMEAARVMGYPVVLKAVGPEIVHKTEVGGVVLDLRDEAAVSTAYRSMAGRLGATMTGAVLQQMVTGGVELLVGAVVDPTFGPLVACGSGGVLVDLLADTSFRLHPLTDLDAADLVGALRCARLLRGYRGQPPADERAVIDTLLRVSTLVETCPEIQELDINPLEVQTRGAVAVDVRVRVGPVRSGPVSRRVVY
jgi:acyl-CoA synthetase (NDP forming)